jgi:hypothetical protein
MGGNAEDRQCVCGQPVVGDLTDYCESCLEASEHEDCEYCEDDPTDV